MILYDGPAPLIARDGYVIDRVDIREHGRGSKDWRADGKNVFAVSLTFANISCVPAAVIRQALGLPSGLREATLRVGPGRNPSFERNTSWGGYGMGVNAEHPECAATIGVADNS